MRESFVFYRSFYSAIRNLPAEEFKNCVAAIAEYALDNKEPETFGIERTVFELAKPQIDANNKRYENGSKGGRPKTQNQTKPNNNQTKPNNNQKEPNDNQNANSVDFEKPNVNVNDNVNVNVNDNVNVNVNDNENVNNNENGSNESEENDTHFIPPTRQEVNDYCLEKGYTNVDVERFIDYYTSNGWMVGKNKMKDWKACVRNWNRGQRQGMTAEPKKSKQHDFEQRNYDMDSMTKALIS